MARYPMNFFRHLKAAWLFYRFTPYVDAVDGMEWTKADAKAHEAYMTSLTGQKLALRINNLITKSAVNATKTTENPLYRNGWASGIAAAFSWMDSHLPKAPEQPTQPAENDWMERFRP